MSERLNYPKKEYIYALSDYIQPQSPDIRQRKGHFETFVNPQYAEAMAAALPFDAMVQATIHEGADPSTAAIQMRAQITRFVRLGTHIHGPGLRFGIDRAIELGELPAKFTYREPGSNMFVGPAYINKQNPPVKATGIDFDRRYVAAGRIGVPELQSKGFILTPEVEILHTDENHTGQVYDLQGHILFTQYKPAEDVLNEAIARARNTFSVDLLHHLSVQTDEERDNSMVVFKAMTKDGRETPTSVGLRLVGDAEEVSENTFIQSAQILVNSNVYNGERIVMDTSPYDEHLTRVTIHESNGKRTVAPWAIERVNITDEKYEKWLSIIRVFSDIFVQRATVTNNTEIWHGDNQSYLVDLANERGLKGRARYTTLKLRPAILPAMSMYFSEQFMQTASMGLVRDVGQNALFASPGEFLQFAGQYLREGGAEQAFEEVKLTGPILGMASFPNLSEAISTQAA